MSPKPAAIVTGASGGIGSGLVEAFQRQLRLRTGIELLVPEFETNRCKLAHLRGGLVMSRRAIALIAAILFVLSWVFPGAGVVPQSARNPVPPRNAAIWACAISGPEIGSRGRDSRTPHPDNECASARENAERSGSPRSGFQSSSLILAPSTDVISGR
jgi:hypothetical protein